MSNAQTQTRGLSAGDWVRLKRLGGALRYKTVNLSTDKDIIPTTNNQLPYHLPIHSFKVVGTSKIRRTASNWTDYKASQTADYILSSTLPSQSTLLTQVRVCDCTNPTTLTVKSGICTKCVVPTHVRIM